MRAWLVAALLASLFVTSTGQAQWAVARLQHLEHAPFATPEGAAQVIVQRPSLWSEEVDVVLYLHGYSGCIEVLAATGPASCLPRGRATQGWGLLDAHREAGGASWLVMPQLAFRARDGSPGAWRRRGEASRFVAEVVARIASDAGRSAPRVRSVLVAAHSAAFETTMAIVRSGEVESLRSVVLFDALYVGGPTFERWVLERPERSLVTLYTGGTTALRNAELARSLRRTAAERLDVEPEPFVVRPGRVVVARARSSHQDVPRRFLATVLRGLLGASSTPR